MTDKSKKLILRLLDFGILIMQKNMMFMPENPIKKYYQDYLRDMKDAKIEITDGDNCSL